LDGIGALAFAVADILGAIEIVTTRTVVDVTIAVIVGAIADFGAWCGGGTRGEAILIASARACANTV
jgi:hypothetical protein